MVHEKIEEFPYGIAEDEAKLLMTSEDIFDILETFDCLEDALNFIKETYGIEAYDFAKKDSEQSIKEEKEFMKEEKECMKNTNYKSYTSFEISDNEENFKNRTKYEPSFFWFPSGRIVRAELY